MMIRLILALLLLTVSVSAQQSAPAKSDVETCRAIYDAADKEMDAHGSPVLSDADDHAFRGMSLVVYMAQAALRETIYHRDPPADEVAIFCEPKRLTRFQQAMQAMRDRQLLVTDTERAEIDRQQRETREVGQARSFDHALDALLGAAQPPTEKK